MEEAQNAEQNNVDDGVFFSIGEVAAQVGVTAATIRNWEKRGLFVSKRGANGYRRFSYGDIRELQYVKLIAKNQDTADTHIRRHDQHHLENLTKDAPSSRKLVSEKWKESRLKRGLSLEEVAQAVNISSSYLFKIENMQANASLEILKRLAEFYGENILYYISDPLEASNHVRKGEGERLPVVLPGVDVASVTALPNFFMSAMTYHIQPHAKKEDTSIHFGQEFVYVLSGSIHFTLGQDRVYKLKKGDALSFFSTEAHQWHNRSSKPAVLLWIYVPDE